MTGEEAKVIAERLVSQSDVLPCEFHSIRFIDSSLNAAITNKSWSVYFRFTDEESLGECPSGLSVLIDNLSGEAKFLESP